LYILGQPNSFYALARTSPAADQRRKILVGGREEARPPVRDATGARRLGSWGVGTCHC
jgi:hypothetical protein